MHINCAIFQPKKAPLLRVEYLYYPRGRENTSAVRRALEPFAKKNFTNIFATKNIGRNKKLDSHRSVFNRAYFLLIINKLLIIFCWKLIFFL